MLLRGTAFGINPDSVSHLDAKCSLFSQRVVHDERALFPVVIAFQAAKEQDTG